MQKGYSSSIYAKSYENVGLLKRLNIGYCSGIVLERSIPHTSYKDICNLYPVHMTTGTDFILDNHHKDKFLQLKDEGIVSICLVSDPMDNIEKHIKYEDLIGFNITPFKDHYVINLQEELKLSSNHKRNIKKANNSGIEIRNVIVTNKNIDYYSYTFNNLYSVLVERHDITGLPNFNNTQLSNQLRVPGTVLFEAYNLCPVGYMLFYVDGDVVRYHLGCYNEKGYDQCASFLLMYEAIKYFKQLGLKYLVLGGSSGSGEEDGLDRFKKGWTSHTKKNYLVTKIINTKIYFSLSEGQESNYFPLYRKWKHYA